MADQFPYNKREAPRNPSELQQRWQRRGRAFLFDIGKIGAAVEIGVTRAEDATSGKFSIHQAEDIRDFNRHFDGYSQRWLIDGITSDQPELQQLEDGSIIYLASISPDSEAHGDVTPFKIRDNLYLGAELEVGRPSFAPSFSIEVFGVGVVTALAIVADGGRLPVWG